VPRSLAPQCEADRAFEIDSAEVNKVKRVQGATWGKLRGPAALTELWETARVRLITRPGMRVGAAEAHVCHELRQQEQPHPAVYVIEEITSWRR